MTRACKRSKAAIVGLCGLCVLAVSPLATASADEPRLATYHSDRERLDVIWQRVEKKLREASAAMRPTFVPPEPVALRWQRTLVGTLGLPAEALAATAADLDGDQRDELIVVTRAQVLVLQVGSGGIEVLSALDLPDRPAILGPRDPVGVVNVRVRNNRMEVRARSSLQARGGTYTWSVDGLRLTETFEGFPMCEEGRAFLYPGRNFFVSSTLYWPEDEPAPPFPERFYSADCIDSLVDSQGRPLKADGQLTVDGILTVRARPVCAADEPECNQDKAVLQSRVSRAGVAWTLTDLDNDGEPEIVASSDGAPGFRDRVVVYGSSGGELGRIHTEMFDSGVVGLVSANLMASARARLFVVSRTHGSNKIELWSLNE